MKTTTSQKPEVVQQRLVRHLRVIDQTGFAIFRGTHDLKTYKSGKRLRQGINLYEITAAAIHGETEIVRVFLLPNV